MTPSRLHIYDTSLRDGAQTNGIDYSLNDKIAVVALLEQLGIDYIEGGYPGANPIDSAFFASERTESACFTAFGMTARPGRSASNDPGLRSLLEAKAKAICFVGKASDYHVRLALDSTLEDNLQSIKDSIRLARDAGREVLLDCEHFFDGYKSDAAYALACAQTAFEAGARWVVLCDTNGGTLPGEIGRIVEKICQSIPGENIGIHAHDDTGQAVANSFAAIEAGARQIQGTLNGVGERCGNADLISIIPTLKLKPAYRDQFAIQTDDEALAQITHISRIYDDIINRAQDPQRPYVGAGAFTTKAGIHASGLLKNPDTYEHVKPEAVGNQRRMLISDQAGKSNLLSELSHIGIEVSRDDPRLDDLLNLVKTREAMGYSYESASASFELLARENFCTLPSYFTVDSFRVMVERRYNALGERVTIAEAVVSVTIGKDTYLSVAHGNGPVNALDLAMRKDLGKYQPIIETLELVDYKVRILAGGTEALTRVLIESRDRKDGARWITVGVSGNIVDASFQALEDSINFALIRNELAKQTEKRPVLPNA